MAEIRRKQVNAEVESIEENAAVLRKFLCMMSFDQSIDFRNLATDHLHDGKKSPVNRVAATIVQPLQHSTVDVVPSCLMISRPVLRWRQVANNACNKACDS